MDDLNVNFGHLENVHKYHSSSSGSSRKRRWHEFEICEEFWKTTRQFFWGTKKPDQWSDRNHWHNPDQFPRFKVGIDKLIAQSNLTICTAKVYVFSHSMLGFGKKGNNPVECWKKQIQWYSDNKYFSEFNRTEWQPMEFESKIFPGFTTVAILNEIQQMMGKVYSVNLRTSQARSSSCQWLTTLYGIRDQNKSMVPKQCTI